MRTIQLKSRGMRQLLNGSQMDKALKPLAEAAAARARASAPRESGEYAGSIRVWSATTDRRVWRYGSDVGHALAVESRTGNLARAL